MIKPLLVATWTFPGRCQGAVSQPHQARRGVVDRDLGFRPFRLPPWRASWPARPAASPELAARRQSASGGATGTGAASRSKTAFIRRIASSACCIHRPRSVKSNALRAGGERDGRFEAAGWRRPGKNFAWIRAWSVRAVVARDRAPASCGTAETLPRAAAPGLLTRKAAALSDASPRSQSRARRAPRAAPRRS